MSGWTPNRLAELSRRWNQGESSAAIANSLGVSRSAVIGKVFRLRKAGHDLRDNSATIAMGYLFTRARVAVRTEKAEAAAPFRPVGLDPFVVEPEPSSPRARQAAEGRAFLAALEAAMPGTGIPFGDLSRRACANITGGEAPNWLFCGAETTPRSRYCAACRPKMYLPVSERS
ncbi:gcrA cell cycle regulator family protein [Asticcacaulis biprosthecium C19]|uniref:GcrA cell cycle regulator family protein n=1 Tax=Asticcacaulis biprosthecium C19 TaxID=715226 RepID=F4QGK9_9CAUL|nr:gcrA cell cycle regulator family protein [Asticcacaulis biprosthecium]EGF93690.1 gcrA cell cycle regulator family protein [Asticcacaulis biprosthecium C19]